MNSWNPAMACRDKEWLVALWRGLLRRVLERVVARRGQFRLGVPCTSLVVGTDALSTVRRGMNSVRARCGWLMFGLSMSDASRSGLVTYGNRSCGWHSCVFEGAERDEFGRVTSRRGEVGRGLSRRGDVRPVWACSVRACLWNHSLGQRACGCERRGVGCDLASSG